MRFRHRGEHHEVAIFLPGLGRDLITSFQRHRLHWRLLLLIEGFYQPIAPGRTRNPACTPKHRYTHTDDLVILGEAESRNQARGQKGTPNYKPDSLHVATHEGRHA
jgi:hypothetical protein